MRHLLFIAFVLSACRGPAPEPAAPETTVSAPDVATTAIDVSAPPPDTAAPLADPNAAFPLWPKLQRGTLANGLTYYIMQHPMPKGRALAWLAIDAGSVQEDDDQRGLAHVLEHMAFEGTKRFPKTAIVDWFERIGMRFGPDVNAYTGFDNTVYQLEVPTDDPVHLGTALDVLRDWARDIEIQPASLERERKVVLEEWRRGRSVGERVAERQRAVLFEGTRYADRLPIGLPDTIEHAPQAAIERFYRDWYRPDAMAVIVIGDVDPTTVKSAIEARFADLTNPTPSRPRIAGGVPPAAPTRVAITADAELASTLVSVYDLLPHRSETTRGDFRRAVGEQLWTLILAERFDILARRPDCPFNGASADIDTLTRDIDMLRVSAEAKPGKADEALRAILTELTRLERHGFTPGEIERARAQFQRFYENYDLGYETEPAATFADEVTRNFFEGEFMIGPAAEKDAALAALPTITRADIEAVTRSFAESKRRSVLLSAPDEAKLPNKDAALAIVAETMTATIDPLKEDTSVGSLIDAPPTPGTITARKTIDAIGVTEWTLSNGVRVIVKPTDFEADAFDMVGSSPGGFATLPDAKARALTFTESVLAVGGLGGLDAVALQRWAAGKSAGASTAIYGSSERVSGSGATSDLETTLELVYLRMTTPRRDDDAIALWKENTATKLEQTLALPETKASRELTAALYQNHPLMAPTEPADIRAIEAEPALAFHKDRFGDATDFTFVIVGDIDLAVLEPLVAKWLASLPVAGRVEKEVDRGVRMVPGVVTKTWKVGKEPKAFVDMWFHGDLTWSRDFERDMSVLEQVLDIRLREVLRQDLGGVYSVSANGVVERSPHPSRLFSISFGCSPDQVDALIAATRAELDNIMKNGVKDDVLDKIRQAVVRDREVSLRTNGTWLAWLERTARYGDDPTTILDPSGYLARVTNEHLKAAAQRYLDPKQVFTSIRLPE